MFVGGEGEEKRRGEERREEGREFWVFQNAIERKDKREDGLLQE